MNIEQIEIFLKAKKNRKKEEENFIAAILDALKQEAVKGDNQIFAKNLWCLQTVLSAQSNYLQAFDSIKRGAFYNAWTLLEKSERDLFFLKPHFSLHWKKFWLDFLEEYVEKLQQLFPYEIFISPEIVEKKVSCNICGEILTPRNVCEHEAGEIYNGKICFRTIEDCDLVATALVKTPANRFAVPFLVLPNTGKTVDQYNYSVLHFFSQKIVSPFNNWSYKKSHRYSPHERFKNIGRNFWCPCSSGKKYKICCLRNPKGVKLVHYELNFE